VIPLAIGILVEAVYTNVGDHVSWGQVPITLLSGHRIALYVGVLVAYVTVISLIARSETNIGLRRIELNALAATLRGASSLFAVAPTPLEEWFDPAAQVYFATLFGARLNSTHPLRYERVLLLPSRKSKRYLDSDYLDGYFAKCLIHIHKELGIDLYFLEWDEIEAILDGLSDAEKKSIGYYSSLSARLAMSHFKFLTWPRRRRRVRRIACGVIETSTQKTVFSFTKRDNVVDVAMQDDKERTDAYLKFVGLIKAALYDGAGKIKYIHDFTKYYDK
jgi:hypothetical protein